jgi:hypothetical protein
MKSVCKNIRKLKARAEIACSGAVSVSAENVIWLNVESDLSGIILRGVRGVILGAIFEIEDNEQDL